MLAILIITTIIIIYIIIYKDHFIAQFDMIINRSLNPIYTNYTARDKITPYGEDTIDLFLKNQLYSEFTANKMNFLK